MTDQNDRTHNKGNAPEIDLRDAKLRSATWEEQGKYGPMYNTKITKMYRDGNGHIQETDVLSSQDLLRVSELALETHREVLERKRSRALERKAERNNSRQKHSENFHDDEKSRSEIKRERFQEKRQSQGTRRSIFRERKAR